MKAFRTFCECQDQVSLEVGLIESAMRLVASGAATRTIVAGLVMTDAALAITAGLAREMDVELGTVPRFDAPGMDVVVMRRPTVVSG